MKIEGKRGRKLLHSVVWSVRNLSSISTLWSCMDTEKVSVYQNLKCYILQSILWIGIKWPESSLSNFLPSFCLCSPLLYYYHHTISVTTYLYTKEFCLDIKFIIVIYMVYMPVVSVHLNRVNIRKIYLFSCVW